MYSLGDALIPRQIMEVLHFLAITVQDCKNPSFLHIQLETLLL